MEYIRVRRVDGEALVCECRNSKSSEGTIGTPEIWQNFLNSLPKPNGKTSKPVALVADADDIGFERPINAAALRGYSLEEVTKRFETETRTFKKAG